VKLHRIEVTNLNSLYDDHAVDLDEALGGADLFLIQGPTGSGKSTLMDAVSLALFATTPRLSALRNEMAIADQVMSRGTGETRASVEFSKFEADRSRRVRYRATWAARRARRRPEGNVQPTERSLERQEPDGAWTLLVSDHRNKVVEPCFHEVLEGFTPHDFQRSMLLAQGRFDAMLHAAPDERAAILERLTDTAIYARLGERAARMRGAWERRLDGLRRQRDAVVPVPEEEIAAARVAAGEAQAAIAEVAARIERLRGWREWLLQGAALARDRGAAEAAVAAAAAREEAARASQAALAEHERCAESFRLHDRCEDTRAGLRKNALAQEEAMGHLPPLEEEAREAHRRADAAEEAVKAAEQTLAALRAPAARAVTARRSVATAEQELKTAAAATQRAAAGVETAEGLAARARGQHEAARRALEEAEAHLAGRAADAPLRELVARLADEAAGVGEARDALERDRERAARLAHELDEGRAALERERLAHEAARKERHAPLERAAAEAQGHLDVLVGGADPDEALAAAQADHLGLLGARAALEGAQREVTARDEARRRAAALGARADAAAAARAAAEERARACAAEEEERTRALVSAEAALEPLARIAALGQERAELVPGEACPLCGSEHHPFVHDDARRAQADAIEEEVAKARQAREAARHAREVAAKATQTAREARAGAAADVRATEEAREVAQREAAAAEARAREALDAAELPEAASVDDVGAALVTLGARVDAGERRRDALQAAIRAARAAAAALAREEERLAQARRRLEGEEARLREAGEERARREAALEARAQRLAQRREALAAALAPFGVAEVPAEAGLAVARSRVEAWESAERGVAEARVGLERAEAAVTSAEAALATARGALTAAQDAEAERGRARFEAAEEAEAALAALEEVWAAAGAALEEAARGLPLLEAARGLPLLERTRGLRADPEGLLRHQEDRVATLRDALEVAQGRRTAAEAALARARERRRTLAEVAAALGEELATREEELRAAVAALHLDDVAALTSRRLDAEEVAARIAQREALRQARAAADAGVAAAARQAARHREERPEGLDAEATPEGLAADLADLAGERAHHEEIGASARATLALVDQKAEAQREAERALAEAQERASVWLHLHELIGKGDGKRFQHFAQALNLDQLLSRANVHLEQLNDRYRLRTERDEETRLPTLEFVVEDRWRPGTRRSLKTLSGGESFLVSLALALGLSDLRTSSMPVETLLLDEGFGSLDPHTLDTALAALQQLRSAGRQVGIISHVAALQEHIAARVLVEPIGEGRSRVRTQRDGP